MIRIVKKDMPFAALSLVLKARSKDEEKKILNHLYVNTEDCYIACADGFRMHFLDITEFEGFLGLENGLYEIAKQSASEIILVKSDFVGNFPNLRSFMVKREYIETELESKQRECRYLEICKAVEAAISFDMYLDLPQTEIDTTMLYKKKGPIWLQCNCNGLLVSCMMQCIAERKRV